MILIMMIAAVDPSGDDSDYRLGEPGPESEDEDEDELDINEEKQSVVTGKKKEKPGRADIIALRRTEPASGTIGINKHKAHVCGEVRFLCSNTFHD
jgi:hypothetical protein